MRRLLRDFEMLAWCFGFGYPLNILVKVYCIAHVDERARLSALGHDRLFSNKRLSKRLLLFTFLNLNSSRRSETLPL